MRAETLAADHVVVGSGPGGAITAALLAESGRQVLLVEDGPDLAFGACIPFSAEEMLLKYRNGGLTASLGSPKVQYVEARVVGGGSEVNSGIYFRTPPETLEAWRREFHLAEATEADLMPHWLNNERELSVTEWAGDLPGPSRVLRDGARALGWRSAEPPRWFTYVGEAAAPDYCGGKQTMSRTFIARARAAGCRVVSQLRVHRVRQAGPGWCLQAVRTAASEPQPVLIQASDVFLAAGAIQTPTILRRSGFRFHVGNSLSFQPMVKVVAHFAEEVNDLAGGVAAHQVKEFAPQISLGSSIGSPPYLALAMRDYPQDACAILADWKRSLVFYATTLGDGRGRVRACPGFNDPFVFYQITTGELTRLATGLRYLGELLFAAGADRLYPSVRGWRWSSPEDLRGLPQALPRRTLGLVTVHVSSSCPIGEDRRRCAADSFGNVFGVRGLHLADASMLCTAPGVNPQGSVMAFARRNILRFLRMY